MELHICLAPLRGVTDAIFRNTYAEFFHGVDWAVTPFLSTVKGPRIKPSHLKDVLPENNRRMAIVPQIISKSAHNFVPLARALFDLGYQTVNWNLGCPFPKVAKKGRGSGMLLYPEAIEAFLEMVLNQIPNQLSIKMRLGRIHSDEIQNLIPILNRYPIKEIILHPRTGIQMYNGQPDLDAFGDVLNHTHHRIIYNGDIVSRKGFELLQERFPQIRTWMIGRGVVSDPFLPGCIKGYQVDGVNKMDRFREYHDTLYARYSEVLYGPSHLVNKMKGLWLYFADAFAEGHRIRKKINKTKKPDHYRAMVDNYFNTSPRWRGDSEQGGKPYGVR